MFRVALFLAAFAHATAASASCARLFALARGSVDSERTAQFHWLVPRQHPNVQRLLQSLTWRQAWTLNRMPPDTEVFAARFATPNGSWMRRRMRTGVTENRFVEPIDWDDRLLLDQADQDHLPIYSTFRVTVAFEVGSMAHIDTRAGPPEFSFLEFVRSVERLQRGQSFGSPLSIEVSVSVPHWLLALSPPNKKDIPTSLGAMDVDALTHARRISRRFPGVHVEGRAVYPNGYAIGERWWNGQREAMDEELPIAQLRLSPQVPPSWDIPDDRK